MGGEKQYKNGRRKSKTRRLDDDDQYSGDVTKSKKTLKKTSKVDKRPKSEEMEKPLKKGETPEIEVLDIKKENFERALGQPKSEDSDFQMEKKKGKKKRKDDDFRVEMKGRGQKRRRESERTEGVSDLAEGHTAEKNRKVKREEEEQVDQAPEMKRKKKVKDEIDMEAKIGNEGQAVSVKRKKTKEELEAAKVLKMKKKEEEEQQRWRWWEEEKYPDGIKWKFLEHKGPYFPPEYQPLPDDVRFFYNGKAVKLSPAAEEVALFFAQMLDHEYTTKDVFRNNFFKDWRKEMTHEERKLITHLEKCDFGELFQMHKDKVEARRNMSKEEKQIIKEANQKIVEEFGYCVLDSHRERIGNFKIEPPGLFRGRGEHPKQGMLKKRIRPEDIIINCSKDSHVPEPPMGHQWKEVRHDNTVTWLASWAENVQGSCKYIMLNANSKLKGEKDWEKYEVARKLTTCVDSIRSQYQQDLKSKQMKTRQRAVALYFIDKLALRAGNEKEEGETADTVGCCSLRVEHIALHERLDGDQHVVEFDFLGKDCIRYYNKVPVAKKVFKNLRLFMENKQEGDDLFDRLTTSELNKHLSSLMLGLTAKVFRTYNASITLQQQLRELSNASDNQAQKLLCYNRANRAVAVLCNHQRAPPKTFEQSMANLQAKIDSRKEQLAQAKGELKQAKKEAKENSDKKLLAVMEKKKRTVQRCEEQLLRMEVQATDREENKQVALSTSKLNYLDPRISVAWCKNMDVPLEKIYNKTQRDKFAWAVDMTEADFEF
uniref:DNA topoisomerase I n=1 Tax=Paramormyrops kingsleyae TaxID=1676925 RepID=A0A3B3RID8_9TELE|nr:DNA topoisomerase I, mitochondrial-like isoform X1 [Paramormyrops kingsleyae]XP_023683060.1 DNA topoisomerase I, mitochondrial-like isoform X1 [Paramormyrops kingsleyae]XP_023683061.1 DNA topoisomerase I, mitochondrial-like isoform X1 [Paramormyrops kingsleyae]XP_023683062.1 DNA topoisomerase I, mitochondrial-like isoform X1 [Paramormyrops kingsleyae]XP_023683064.1 DNA topoisomerase I, mitochondrial-like isoform X1 [Paramormyrops kingsleyae]XP_023683065.1 DNA topoisomerase I, mitochondrial-